MAESAPFFVTAMAAAAAWTFTHAADRLSETPYLKYSVEEIKADDKQSTYVNIKNITHSTTFKNVTILVTTSPKDTVIGGSVIPHQPAFEGNDPWTIAGRTFSFTFPEIQPGWHFDVSILHRTDEPAFIRLSTLDGPSFYAVRPSLETYLVENEMIIILIFFGIATIILGFSFLISGRQPTPTSPNTIPSAQIAGPPQNPGVKP